jgi:YHS domain-containing protein
MKGARKMKRTLWIIGLAGLIFLVPAVPSALGDDANSSTPAVTKPQTTCPVMGGAINKKIYRDYQGKRVYFCCGGCVAAFAKDPEKYMKKLQEAGVTLEEAPSVSDKKAE